MTKSKLRVLFWINILIVFCFWTAGSGLSLLGHVTIPILLLSIARLCGLLSVSLVLTQFLLIGRIGWIEPVVGHDKLAQIHRRVGKYALYSIIVHFCLIVISYAWLSKVNVVEQFLILLNSYEDIPKAFIAFLLFLFIVPLSIFIHRLKLKYETWYFVHLMLYIAVLFAFGHQMKLGGDFTSQVFVYYWYALYIFVLGNFALFRFVRPIYLFLYHSFEVQKVVRETSNATSIYITGKHLEDFKRTGGQFMIVRFFDSKRWWQAHPFSLSWGSKNNLLRITVKNSGDYTSEIGSLKPGIKVLIDGMHGIFTKNLAVGRKILFLVGGIGITPIRAMIEEMSEKGDWDMLLLYSNKTAQDIVFSKELAKFGARVINIISEDSKYKGEKGRIDKEKLERLVGDITKREVYLCGPTPFMEALTQACLELGVKKDRIHFEKFSLH